MMEVSDASDRYSQRQVKMFATLPSIVCPLSIIGSSAIIYMIHLRKERRLYHHLMLSISAVDILVSLIGMLGPMPVPESTGAYMARGNTATCEMQGFIMHMTISGVMYNMFLMITFVKMVRYNVKEESLSATRYEMMIHTIALGFPIITGSIALALDLFNPVAELGALKCYFAAYPSNCDMAEFGGDGEQSECTRGENSKIFFRFFSLLPFLVCMVVLFGSIVLVCYTAHQHKNSFITTRNQQRCTNGRTTCTSTISVKQPSNDNNDNINNTLSSSMRTTVSSPTTATERTATTATTATTTIRTSNTSRTITTQAIIYGIFFFNTYAWRMFGPVVEKIFHDDDAHSISPPRLVIRFLSETFYFSQGFFNFFVYIRPRFIRIRNNRRDQSFWWAFREAAFGVGLAHARYRRSAAVTAVTRSNTHSKKNHDQQQMQYSAENNNSNMLSQQQGEQQTYSTTSMISSNNGSNYYYQHPSSYNFTGNASNAVFGVTSSPPSGGECQNSYCGSVDSMLKTTTTASDGEEDINNGHEIIEYTNEVDKDEAHSSSSSYRPKSSIEEGIQQKEEKHHNDKNDSNHTKSSWESSSNRSSSRRSNALRICPDGSIQPSFPVPDEVNLAAATTQ